MSHFKLFVFIDNHDLEVDCAGLLEGDDHPIAIRVGDDRTPLYLTLDAARTLHAKLGQAIADQAVLKEQLRG